MQALLTSNKVSESEQQPFKKCPKTRAQKPYQPEMINLLFYLYLLRK
jgi:hypothetical protein